eukprot:127838_1
MTTQLQAHEIIKQGWLQKKSKHLGSWRSRWMVLTAEYLYSYHDRPQNASSKAKTSIKLLNITVSSFDDAIFTIKGAHNYSFKTKTESDKTEWIDCINKYTHNCIKMT